MGAGFVATCGALATAATLGLPPRVLRAVRLVAGGAAAVTGAVLTLQLSFMAANPEEGDPSGLSGALIFALVFAGVGAWVADLRLTARAEAEQAERDRLAADRHDELLALKHASHGLRPRDLGWLLAASWILRRR